MRRAKVRGVGAVCAGPIRLKDTKDTHARTDIVSFVALANTGLLIPEA